jgi:hypothetical protein
MDEKACSIGLRSGEYGGRYMSLAPRELQHVIQKGMQKAGALGTYCFPLQ